MIYVNSERQICACITHFRGSVKVSVKIAEILFLIFKIFHARGQYFINIWCLTSALRYQTPDVSSSRQHVYIYLSTWRPGIYNIGCCWAYFVQYFTRYCLKPSLGSKMRILILMVYRGANTNSRSASMPAKRSVFTKSSSKGLRSMFPLRYV